ncbi:ABC transporter substrate-binding protein [Buchananella hordeovulneris]|uniref:ABC transporter substrate-binding protein n=1 Tax=Buchananella hordeovulneris TaxID=52770 RepID=UPI0026DD6BAA|nr:ABC transporter substrate-binding protein [Buchananella hordeovulneris]MDO5079672.1 ABC transporter substrate-binding protein [Buchananella hordeovulneris]
MKKQLAGLTVALLLLSGCSEGEDSTEVTVGLTFTPNVQFAPAYVAAEEQLFTEAGVSAKLRHHGANESLFGALLDGTEDLVIAGADEAAVARAGGADLVVVGPYYATHPTALIARADAQVASPADLRGKRIGIPGPYGENYFALQHVLQEAGLNDSDVDVKHIGFTQVAALATNEVDAVIGFANNEPVQAAAQGVEVTVLPLGERLPLVGASLVTTERALASKGPQIRAAVAALALGRERTVHDPDLALRATATYVPELAASDAQEAAKRTLTQTLPLWAEVDYPVLAAKETEMADFLANIGAVEEASQVKGLFSLGE